MSVLGAVKVNCGTKTLAAGLFSFAHALELWEFGPEKNYLKLREYERGLEALFHQRRELQGICQYHLATGAFFARHEAGVESFWRLRRVLSAVVGHEKYILATRMSSSETRSFAAAKVRSMVSDKSDLP